MSLTEAIVGFPVGGQVLISGSTYQRIYGRLHTIGPLHPISTAQGRSALGRSRSRRLSQQPREGWKGKSSVQLLSLSVPAICASRQDILDLFRNITQVCVHTSIADQAAASLQPSMATLAGILLHVLSAFGSSCSVSSTQSLSFTWCCHAMSLPAPFQGVCCATGLTVEVPSEPDTARSTAGLLSPDSSAMVGTPATPHLSVSQASEPGNRGYLADGITRWGSFTQEQLAAFG